MILSRATQDLNVISSSPYTFCEAERAIKSAYYSPNGYKDHRPTYCLQKGVLGAPSHRDSTSFLSLLEQPLYTCQIPASLWIIDIDPISEDCTAHLN